MASVFKKPKSPYWWAAFRGADGRRVQRSTKQNNHAQALRIALEWDRLAEKGRAGALTEAQARRVISTIVEDATGEALHFHSCRDWLNEWVAIKRGSVAAKSIEKYAQVVADFLEHLGDRAKLPLAGIGPKDIRNFRDTLAKGNRTAGTVNQVIRKVLAAPFAQALRLGYITTNPCAAVDELNDNDETVRDVFTREQVAKLLKSADDDWKGVILCGYTTGLRLRDITDMHWSAVDFEAGTLKIKVRKTGKTVTVPLHEDLANWLRSRPRGIAKAHVFPALAGKGTGGRYGLSGRFAAIMEAAGIKGRIRGEGQGRKTSSLSFHCLRHTFNSAMANAGVTQELRSKLTGHATARQNDNYTHHELAVLRNAVATVPSVGGKGK